MIRRVIIPGLIVLTALLGAIALTATAPTLEPSQAGPSARTVRAIEVKLERVSMIVNSQGTAAPHTESDLIAEVNGRVTSISPALKSGGYFSAGDVLLELDAADYEAAVARAKASLVRAEAEFRHASFEYERHSDLASRDLASRSRMEEAQRMFKVAEATLGDARVALQQAERDLRRTKVTAPFTGLVRSKAVDLGQFVTRGALMARVYASDRVEVRLPLADRQLAFLNLPLNQRGEIPTDKRPAVILRADYAGQNLSWHGEIVRTEAEIDPRSRMIYVVAQVENNAHESPLTIGLYVEAEIEGALAEDVAVLPRDALRSGNQVLVIDEDNRLRFRRVELLRLYGDEALIRSGLNPGDKVCVSPIQTVVEGMRVDPIYEEAEQTAARSSVVGGR